MYKPRLGRDLQEFFSLTKYLNQVEVIFDIEGPKSHSMGGCDLSWNDGMIENSLDLKSQYRLSKSVKIMYFDTDDLQFGFYQKYTYKSFALGVFLVKSKLQTT